LFCFRKQGTYIHMNEAEFVIGIDLGTSNCAMAYAPLAQGAKAAIADFPIVQVVRPGEIAPQPLFPSCLYIAGEHELDPANISLPWGDSRVIAGEFARWQGSRVPGRLVASAKSWLSHPGVDRSAPILPWGAPEEVTKLSPVDASAGLLKHMLQAWNHTHPKALLPDQDVVITVPASFDEVARALTVSAARQAGLERFTLVEEPQAAFYDFTARHRSDLSEALRNIRLVLVIDVGGGTSDFTLVHAGVTPEGPVLKRLAVGEHLMLGGENMDAALARKAEEQMIAGGRKLSATQWTQLVQTARAAKERLLSADPPETYHLSIAAEGSRLLGGSLSARLTREEAERTVLEGFFPCTKPDELPQRTARAAIQELGLPYAKDPAITRQLAAFLRLHAKAGFAALGEPFEEHPQTLPRPDAILLNGGVFNSPKISSRLIDALSAWWPDQPPVPLLEHDSLELAVARGAAYYGLVRRGLGRRIGGGAAHAFYIGLQDARGQPQALCVIPRGHEEGETVELTEQKFQLTLGRPVQFPIYSTAADRVDRSGEVVPVTEDLQPLRPIHTLLKSGKGKTGEVPVHLRAALTEIGTLEISCVSEVSDERWRLEFELRGTPGGEATTVTESMPARFAEARQWIELIFGNKPQQVRRGATESSLPGAPPKDIKQLWSSLERTLGPRESWRVPVLRELWSVLHAGAARRRRSAGHERIFFQLAGFTLRPGFGYPLDEWRCEQMFPFFADRVQHHKERPVWNEFWVMWRRIAGGLTEAHQREIWAWLKPHLAVRLDPKKMKHAGKPKGVQPEGLEEMVRTAASLEHLPFLEKAEAGSWIAAKLREPGSHGGPWAWALGRLGARVPLYGSVHHVIPSAHAADWIQLILDLGAEQVAGGTFALAQLARLSGDRARDIDDATRLRVVRALEHANAPAAWQRMVIEIVQLEADDEARALGDTLPAGLTLIRE
jgi:molecular chaperone DnaK (HSP70)